MTGRDPHAQRARAAGEVQRRIERHRLAVHAGSAGCGNVGEQDVAVDLADVDAPLDASAFSLSWTRAAAPPPDAGLMNRTGRRGGSTGRQPRGAPSGAVTVRKLLRPACSRRSP
jgi:hypothetical protein